MRILQQDNIGSHYRSAIYQLMDKELGCDFCFGDKVDDIKKMDYSKLEHKVYELHNYFFRFGYWQKGLLAMLNKPYDCYVLAGETRCVSTWIFLAVRKLMFPNKSVFLWSHGLLGKESKLKVFLIKIFYSMTDGAFIYNERSRNLMIKQGIKQEKLTTIYNSLDYDKQFLIRNSLVKTNVYKEYFCNTNNNIVFIGRLTKVKRFDLLIDAVSILKQRGLLVNVTFIGDGVERPGMEQRVVELGIKDQVWFYGASYDEKKNAEMIYNADLCVSPGNIGLTAMHVLMFGCPAITNDDFNHQMPEFESIKSGKTGDFFSNNDSQSLADSISKWFNTHTNDRELIRMNCYAEIDNKWNPHNQISILKKTLNKVG